MNAVFLKVLNMSAAASWLIGAVVLLRLLLKSSPRWVVCLLWAVAAVRLVCPLSFESRVSMIPSAEVIPQTVITENSFDIRTGIEAIDVPVNEYLGDHYYEGVTVPTDNGANVMGVLALVWIAGMVLLTGYAVFSYGRLRRRMATAVRLRDNIFQSENVDSPFVMGLILPKIYLPFGMEEGQMAHVIRHENAHIARRDHWWKPLGYWVLALHWFNPLVWLGYILFCQDLELACDERAVRSLDGPGRAEYTEALVRYSLRQRAVAACPLAFGEVGVKARVRSILNYRKPAFWAVVAAVAVCICVCLCFLTDPVTERTLAMAGTNVADLEPGKIVRWIEESEKVSGSGIYTNGNNFGLHLNGDFTWADSQTVRYFYYESDTIRSGQLRIFPDEGEYFLPESGEWTQQASIYTLRNYLDAVKYLPQAEISALCPGAGGYILSHVEEGTPGDYDRVITYDPGGAGEIDGWYIHLQIQPLWDGHGTGEDVVDVFYGDRTGEKGVLRWFDRSDLYGNIAPVSLEAFPGVTFRTGGGTIYALVTDPETGESGESVLMTGMPIDNAWFCDITGDGLPEICATSYFGSGLIDERVQIYDYARNQRWELQNRGIHDFRLCESEGWLCVERRNCAEEPVLDSSRLMCRDGAIMLEDGTVFQKHLPQITGEVTGYHGSALLVRPVIGTPLLSDGTDYCVPMNDNLLAHRPRVGDTVVVAYDGTVQEIYPPVLYGSDVLYVIRQTLSTDLRPMLFAEGNIFMDAGLAVPAEIDLSAVLGQIRSSVSADEIPEEEGQSNFGCEGSRYARFEDGLVVEIGGEWFFFEPLTLDGE